MHGGQDCWWRGLWFSLAILLLVTATGCSDSQTPAGGSSASGEGRQSAGALLTDAQLRQRLDKAIDYTFNHRHLDTKVTAAWQVVHGILAFGPEFEVYSDGKLVSALDYLLKGGQLNGWNLRKGTHGVDAILEAGSKTGQGHPDQWLGYLSQCGMPAETPLVVDREPFKIADLITQAQWNITQGMEATWTLMAFSSYVPLKSQWTSKDGTSWTVERIVDMEASQDINASPCGGSHRLYGLSVALNRHLAEGGKPTGPWQKAEEKIDFGIAKSKEFQEPNGSFSTKFFERPGTSSDVEQRLYATGHTLEFLTMALKDDQLKEPWVTRAVDHLLGIIELTQDYDLECGKLYHAIHGLELYRMRRFGARPLPKPASTATTQTGVAK